MQTHHYTSVLNPRYKLQYFKKANWPSDWIQTAQDITRDEYERTYANCNKHSNSASSHSSDDGLEILGNDGDVTTNSGNGTSGDAKVCY